MTPKNFICSRCKLACRDNHDLQKHLDKKKKCVPVETPVEPAAEPKRWHCEPCKSTFSSQGNYKSHLNTQSHKRITSTDTTTPVSRNDGQTIPGTDEEAATSSDIAGPSIDSNEPAGEEMGIEFVLPTVEMSKIRKTNERPPRIAVFDLIAAVTGQHINARKIYSRLVGTQSEIKVISSLHKFKGRGQQYIPVIPVANIGLVLKLVVPGLRIPLAKKQALLGMSLPLRSFTEIEIHENVKRALSQFPCVPQFQVGKYRLDLYFPNEKVAVECDEYNHIGYNQTKEKERHDTITARLGCTWIRYDPYDRDFNIFGLINQILCSLMLSRASRT